VSQSSQLPQSSESKPAQGRVQGSESSGSSRRKPRRRLAPSEKYELFVQVLTQQATQREAAERWEVDRSTVVGICRTAKQGALDALAGVVPGRPGRTPEQVELAAARSEIERLRATVTEQAVVLHLQQGKASWA
jgi:transposase-like protein